MIATALDRLEARLSPARFPKPESVPQVEAPSLAYADMTHDPRRPSRNPGELAVIEGIFGCVRVWRSMAFHPSPMCVAPAIPTCEAKKQWSPILLWCPMWLLLHMITLLPIVTNGWITLASNMKQFSPMSFV